MAVSITKVTQGINQEYDDNARKKVVVDLSGLAADEKPMGYANGSTFLEMDTGKVFVFSDVQGSQSWIEL